MTLGSPADFALLQQLRHQYGVLKDVAPGRCRHDNGQLMVLCSDGDVFPKLFDYHRQLLKLDRLHPLAWNGGGLRLDVHSILGQHHNSAEVLLNDIIDARKLKNMSVIELWTHYPCGAADLAGMGVMDIIQSIVNAKQFLRQSFGANDPVKIIPLCHVAWANHKRRSYYIDLARYKQFINQK